MPTLLGRIKEMTRPAGRSKHHGSQIEPASTVEGLGNQTFCQKIHPDLDSLLDQASISEQLGDKSKDPFRAPELTHIQSERHTEAELALLNTSARRRLTVPTESKSSEFCGAPCLQQNGPIPSNDGEAHEAYSSTEKSLSSSLSSKTEQDISNDTFGRKKRPHSRQKNRPSPQTPDSETSNPKGAEERSHSESTTPVSSHNASSNASHRDRSRQETSSSRNTFGVPSPSFTPTSHRKSHASASIQPPMPPLDHPAFRSASTHKSLYIFTDDGSYSGSRADDVRKSREARHWRSLPSLSQRGRATSERAMRRRARTQPNNEPLNFSLQATSHIPCPSRRRSHSASQNSGTSTTEELSSKKASPASHRHDIGESWETQVSREMLRMLGDKPEENVIAVQSSSKLGHARGNTIGLQHKPAGTPPLGSPFLLQHAHTHYLSLETHCSDTQQCYPPISGTSDQNSRILVMSKDSNSQVLPKSITSEPSRPPSPPLEIDTHPVASSASHLAPPSLSFTAATPEASPITSLVRPKPSSEPVFSVLRVPTTPPASNSTSSPRGKRKADEADVNNTTPPKETKEHRATFALEPRAHRASANSNSARSGAPSSYHRKRARLSTASESRPGSRASVDGVKAASTGSWSSKHSAHTSSQHPSHRAPAPAHQPPQKTPSRRSLSQASIPMSALVTPHAPSVSRSSTFHMRDPRRPPPIQSTPWSLALPSGPSEPGEGWRGWTERGGSPLHAWIFFFGFILFPLWWIASFTGTPKTRRLDGGEQEKGVVLDDPQVEFDAKSWRVRCRIMAVISFFTYIPFIILVAIFA